MPGSALSSQSVFKTSNDVVNQTPNMLDLLIYVYIKKLEKRHNLAGYDFSRTYSFLAKQSGASVQIS